VNTAQTEQLLETVQRYLSPQGDELLLDVYCGVGTFGVSLADRVGRVIGIEEDETAVADARFNSQGTDQVQFLVGRAEELLPALDEKVDMAVIDPPREGLHKKALGALLKLAPRRVVYVSCDPATLARDAGRMVRGGYKLSEVQPVDMFPQTYHIEAVALLDLAP
jgi:23S rRNA (uracil1939-C5)-methyltransferase